MSKDPNFQINTEASHNCCDPFVLSTISKSSNALHSRESDSSSATSLAQSLREEIDLEEDREDQRKDKRDSAY